MIREKDIEPILAVRHFNRFYTHAFGFLQKRILGSAYSLVDARVLYELANRPGCHATDITTALDLDPGYLSRILKKFETAGLIVREPSAADGRCRPVALTDRGEQETAKLADIANDDVANKLGRLSEKQIAEVVTAMQTIENTLHEATDQHGAAVIRSHRPGDIGWVISVHGAYYAHVHGFNENFEALVARICSDFISSHDPKTEHCWIAEVNGKRAGSIFLVRQNETTAKLRLLYVDETARGLGLGKKLVDECLSFARRARYERVELWTNAVLTTARHIYEQAGFHLIDEDQHSDFGDPQIGQHWQLDL